MKCEKCTIEECECTHAQNQQNSNGCSKRLSKYKGVSMRKFKTCTKWRAGIGVNGKRQNLGHFETEELAAEAYNIAALELHGEFARLNNIGGV